MPSSKYEVSDMRWFCFGCAVLATAGLLLQQAPAQDSAEKPWVITIRIGVRHQVQTVKPSRPQSIETPHERHVA
jgi:hypothetical protein